MESARLRHHSSHAQPNASRGGLAPACLFLAGFAFACGADNESDPSVEGGDAAADSSPPGNTDTDVSPPGDTAADGSEPGDILVDVPEPGDTALDSMDADSADDGSADAAVAVDREAILEELAVEQYLALASAGDAAGSCTPVQESVMRESQCTLNSDCGEGTVCRDVRVFGLDSQCTCVAADSCVVSEPVVAGSQCLPGVAGPDVMCGGGLGTALCTSQPLPGPCLSDDDCVESEQCIVVRDVCGSLEGTACVPDAGNGCLVSGSCPMEHLCVPSLSGAFSCVEQPACD